MIMMIILMIMNVNENEGNEMIMKINNIINGSNDNEKMLMMTMIWKLLMKNIDNKW